jgi:hypothetical protein
VICHFGAVRFSTVCPAVLVCLGLVIVSCRMYMYMYLCVFLLDLSCVDGVLQVGPRLYRNGYIISELSIEY